MSQPSTPFSPTSGGFPQELVEVGGFMVEIACPICQTRFQRNRTIARRQARNGKTQYCGQSCRTKGTFAKRPELREQAKSMMQTLNKGRTGSWNSGKPWSDDHRAKRSAAMKGRMLLPFRGGNGTGMSPTEALIAPIIPEGFSWNYVIPSGGFGQGYPSNYKLDFADPRRMVCLEVDGPSHRTKLGQERDARKNKRLSLLGWKVCRIDNETAWYLYSTSKLKEHLHTLLLGA
jgi:hypothetical protein